MLVGAAVPLAFHTYGPLGFEATKATIVRVVALVLALGFLVTALRAHTASEVTAAFSSLPRPSRLVLFGLIAFCASQLLSTALSVAPHSSIWGAYDRVQGLVTVASFAVLGIAAAQVGRDRSSRRRVTVVWLAASAPVCLYALVQHNGLDTLGWLNWTDGVASTLGSSTALGSYLAMLAPLTLGYIARSARDADPGPARVASSRSGWIERVGARASALALWVVLLVLQVASLLYADVRGAMLGLGVGVGTFGSVLLYWIGRRGYAAALAGLVATVVLACVAVSVRASSATADASDDAVATVDRSARQRLLIWGSALSTVGSSWRLVTGYGPETQVVALEPQFPAELAALASDLRFDRAHNVIVDLLLTGGLVGLAAAALLLVSVLWAGATAFANCGWSERTIGAAIVGSVAANLTGNLVAFDSIATGSLLWMVGGMLVGAGLPALGKAAPSRSRASRFASGHRPAPPSRLPIARLAVLSLMALGLLAAPWLVAAFASDLHYSRALALRAGEAPASSVAELLAAIEWSPHQDLYYVALGGAYQELARGVANRSGPTPASFPDLRDRTPDSRDALLEAARISLEQAVALAPLDPYNHLHLARFWALASEVSRDPAERTARQARASEQYQRASELSPSRAAFYDEAAELLIRSGRPDEAIAKLAEAERRSRPSAERLARLGDAAALRGDDDAARRSYEAALALDSRNATAEHGLAELARKQGDLNTALEHAQRAARFQMRNWEYRRHIAELYRDLGQWPEALVEARAARRFGPAWEWDELTQFVESVRQ